MGYFALLGSDKGVLLTFGDGRHGKLGLGVENFANQFIPSQVTRFSNFHIEKVMVSRNSCFIHNIHAGHNSFHYLLLALN